MGGQRAVQCPASGVRSSDPITPLLHHSNTPPSDVARLDDDRRRLFEVTGFLIVEGALPPEMTERLRERALALYEADLRAGKVGPHDFWEMRNCLPADEAFLHLIDWSATFPLVVDLLGWNLQLSTSHLTV